MTDQLREPEVGPRSGEWVTYLQALLELVGYAKTEPITADLADVDQALRAFQKDHGLDSNGIVNGATWAALLTEANAKFPDTALEIDWVAEYPEIFALASSNDFGDYIKDLGLAAEFADDSEE